MSPGFLLYVPVGSKTLTLTLTLSVPSPARSSPSFPGHVLGLGCSLAAEGRGHGETFMNMLITYDLKCHSWELGQVVLL